MTADKFAKPRLTLNKSLIKLLITKVADKFKTMPSRMDIKQ